MPDSSDKTIPMDDLEMALLSGRGYTGTMLVTSGDPGWILTPFMIQLRRAGGDEGPACGEWSSWSRCVTANKKASFTGQ